MSGLMTSVWTHLGDSKPKLVVTSIVAGLAALRLLRWSAYNLTRARENRIQGKQFVITGACGALGTCVCRALLEEGADTLVLWDSREGALRSLRAELMMMRPGIKVLIYKVNLLDVNQIRCACQDMFSKDDLAIDVLICAAGITYCGLIAEITHEQEIDLIQTNYLSQIELTKLFVPYMEKRGKGHIATVASMAGFSGGVGMSTYCASKFALRGYFEGLAAELWYRKSPISVSVFCPGAFNSKLFEGFEMPFPLIKMLTVESVAIEFVENCLKRRYTYVLYPFYLAPLGVMSTVPPMFGKMFMFPVHVTKNWKGATYIKNVLEYTKEEETATTTELVALE